MEIRDRVRAANTNQKRQMLGQKKTDPDFNVLQYWKPRAIDGLDASGTVILPARWPHVGLVARLYAGIDTTRCQAERNFSALKLAVSDLRASMSPTKVEQTLFLRLNRHLIPGLGEVLTKREIFSVIYFGMTIPRAENFSLPQRSTELVASA